MKPKVGTNHSVDFFNGFPFAELGNIRDAIVVDRDTGATFSGHFGHFS